MIKKIFICYFILFCLSHFTAGQNNFIKDKSIYPKKNIIKAFYYGSGGGGYNLAYERILKRKISFQLKARYIRYKGGIFSYDSYHHLDLQPEIRYYLSKRNAPLGFYLGANLYFELLKIIYKYNPPSLIRQENMQGFYFGQEIHLGYQIIIKKTISLDANAGIRYINRVGDVHVADYNFDGTVNKYNNPFDKNAGYFTPTSLLPSFNFLLGIAF